MAANDNRPTTPEDPGRRASVVALLAVVIIGLALFWTISAIRRHDSVQNCIDSGRHDCIDLDDKAR